MYEGMRVVYDPQADHYLIATNLYYPGRDANEMGAIAVKGSSGEVKWMRAFPATQGSMHGAMSQPYALAYAAPTLDAPRSYAIGGHWFWSEQPENVLQAGGRMIGVTSDGELSFDTRWVSGEKDANIECYGLQATSDGGFVMTCGNGVEPELHPHDSMLEKTWMVFVARTDQNGNKLWAGNFSEPEHLKLQNDAGEYVVATRSGKIAVYVDAQSWGPSSTGGNFALMMLDKETTNDR